MLTVCAALCGFTNPNDAILSAAPGDRVELGDGVWVFSAEIGVDLTIASMNPGQAVIVPEGEVVFDVTAPVSFAIEDVGFGPGSGGIVRSLQGADVRLSRVVSVDLDPITHLVDHTSGSLLIEDSSFSGAMTTMPGESGPVLAAHATTAWLERVTIAPTEPSGAARGGALYASEATLTLVDSDIFGASTEGDGGAVFADYGTTLTITGGSFTDNTAGGAGGHVFAGGYGNGVTLTDVVFTRGVANGDYWGGGAVYGANFVEGCSFVDNSALQGGALLSMGDHLEVVDSVFTGSGATVGGGAVYTDSMSWVTIRGSTFGDNHAWGGSGGAIAHGWGGDLTIDDSTFVGNTAFDFGGALISEGPSWTEVNRCTFQGNAALEGGAVAFLYRDGYGANVSDGVMAFNTASASGGAILLNSAGAVNVARTRICGNVAGWEGGGIAAYGSSYPDSLHLKNAAVLDNGAYLAGGGLVAYGQVDDVLIQNSDLLGNTSGVFGSAATVSGVGMVEVKNSLFAWNGASSSGLWVDTTQLYAPWVAYDAWWENVAQHAGGEVSEGYQPLHADPMLTDYTPGGDCLAADLTPLAGSPLIDAGDPQLTDLDGTRSDIGVTGGPYAVAPDTTTGTGTTGTGTGTGTGAGTGTGTGEPTDRDEDGYAAEEDCDDRDPDVHPGRPETLDDGIDNDCDGFKSRSWLAGSACDQGRAGGSWLALGLAGVLARRRRAAGG